MSKLFPSIVGTIPEATLGAARVAYYDVTRLDSMFSSFTPGAFCPEGRYAQLYVGGRLMMSDTPMEHRTNYGVVRMARGRVLIAGLGLGMILRPILDNEAVESVTVVEKSRDVVDLIGPHYACEKLRVICADIFEWRPAKGEKFDCIYFDIWPDKCADYLPEMARLHQRFKSYKSPGGWMDSWCRDEIKAYQRRSGW